MNRCLTLAKKGTGVVSPNPLVGAVIVKNGKKIAEGYHERYGGNHAEVNAIRQALLKKADVNGATIYINLEPCFHTGKTPPCVNAIIKYGFSKVIIATEDPNPLVAGKSITKLRKHGIEVNIGVLKKQAEVLNEKFFKYIRTHIPYVALKAAQTSDGFIAGSDGSSKWITNTRSRRMVHHLRNEYDAVLVGAATVRIDNPRLTVRTVKGRSPVRVIIDGKFTIPVTSRILNNDAKTIMYVSERYAKLERKKQALLTKMGIVIVQMKTINESIDIINILLDLTARGITSILVEGGQRIFTDFINSRCVDKLCLFTSVKIFGTGLNKFGDISVSYKKRKIQTRSLGSDCFQEYSIEYE